MMQSTIMYKELWAHEGFAEYVQKLYSSEYLPLLNQLIEDLPDITKNIEKATNANHIRWAKLFEDGQNSVPMPQLMKTDIHHA
jgi:hypothetical protein